MKCTIFCSLALCAFQTVFADDSHEFGRVGNIITREETGNKIVKALGKYQKPFWDAVDATKPKGKATDEIKSLLINCLIQAENHNGYNKIYDAATNTCDKCYDKADKTKNIKVANKCCDKAIAAFLKASTVIINKCVACVAKCDKLGADDCLKMADKLSVIKTKIPGIRDRK